MDNSRRSVEPVKETSDMLLSMIVAMDRNRVIGVDNDLPWRLPDDLRFFRRVTLGKPVIMGRKTFESIGRPLPKRHNVVLTRNRDFDIRLGRGKSAATVTLTNAMEQATLVTSYADEVVVMGGETLYRHFLPQVQRLYLTLVDAEVDGDTFFPEIEWGAWNEVSREAHSADSEHAYAFEWVVLERKVSAESSPTQQ